MEENRKVKIFVFVSGVGTCQGIKMWTTCAITEHGRWIAGAVSRESEVVALIRCQEMAERKAVFMLSGPCTVEIVNRDPWNLSGHLLRVALEEAFRRLP